ncbi:copper resistance CopC family protein [Paenisporosarcina sp. FSL H8-0542]|uniref:copper resistance CopC family protein n=1 Tax=Paenisporosarcina sp. FSL H8-0542 TaxID=2921401 RepID=UPI00315B0AA0
MKKLIILTLLFLFIFSPSALGHSGLSSSTPANGEVVKEELSSITLLFNTTVENTSILKVINEDGGEVHIEELLIKQNEMIGRFSEPLEEGEFTVNWKIIGADGHPIENTFSFRVELPKETDSEVPNQQSPEEIISPPSDVNDQKLVKEAKDSNNIMISAALLLVLIAICTTFWLLRKEESK